MATLARLSFAIDAGRHVAAGGANAVAAEAVGAIKTVAAFCMQPTLVSLYGKHLARATPLRSAFNAGLGFGFAEGMLKAVAALAFWFGWTQVKAGRMTFEQVIWFAVAEK